MITYFIAAFIILFFTIVPGSWFICPLALNELRLHIRFALAAALSPAVLALQFLALKWVGIGFEFVPTALVLLNLPALFFILRALWQANRLHSTGPQSNAAVVGGTLFFALLTSYLVIPWRLIPNLRPFAWHALWHTDITYTLMRPSLLPEEPELAGMRLAYGWVGHVYWAVVGWLTNLPPTITYAISNVIWLLVALLLIYELCVKGLKLQPALAWLGSGMLFVGTNIVGVVLWSYARDWHWHREYLGDLRYTPLLSKYIGFETMPFAFALLIGTVLLCVLALQQRLPRLPLLLGALLTALGLIYPLLLPAAGLVAGIMWLLLVTRFHSEKVRYEWRTLLGIAIAALASMAIAYLFLTLVTADSANQPIHLTVRTLMREKGMQSIVALLLFAPALLYLATTLPRRAGPAILLTGATLGLVLLYVVADLEGLEYKYILAASIVAAPLAAAGIGRLLRAPALRWGTAFGVTALLIGANQLFMLRIGAQVPSNLANAPHIDESAFQLRLDVTQAEANWVEAIRAQTADDTIVVTNGSRIHLGPFVDRSLYIPSDILGEATTGYSVDNRYNLLTWRGYPANLYEARVAVVAALYGEQPAAWADALQQLMTLGRPLALHFNADAAQLDWLRNTATGEELFADQQHVVWLLTPGTVVQGSTDYAKR